MNHIMRLMAFMIVSILAIAIPQTITYAAVTYTTCPDFTTFENDVDTDGDITFNIASPCTIVFDNTINPDVDNTIVNLGASVIFDGDDSVSHFYVYEGSLTLDGITLVNGSEDDGGSIYVEFGNLIIRNSTFSDNSADDDGGAIYNVESNVTITNSTFTNNYTNEYGGVIYHDEGYLNIAGSRFLENDSGNDSGVVEIYGGTAIITGSVFAGNYADDDGGVAYIYGDAIVTISHSSFSNNISDYWGGVFYISDSSVTVTNSTFYNNESYYQGGAIYVSGGSITLIHTTIADNRFLTGPSGASIYASEGDATLIASIIRNGDCDEDDGIVTDGGDNIAFNATDCPGTVADPLLGAFGSGVLPISLGSPAMDIYPAPCLVGNDQLGTARPQFNGCDAGAVEYVEGMVIVPDAGPLVLGCTLDAPTGVELANMPDNTYCTILMRNGAVVAYEGAIPSDLIGLGVILAVDIFRMDGGRSITEFPDYGRVCLRGTGRMFYMDSRNAPRYSIEMPTERVDNLTCAWIPAPGTLILTN